MFCRDESSSDIEHMAGESENAYQRTALYQIFVIEQSYLTASKDICASSFNKVRESAIQINHSGVFDL